MSVVSILDRVCFIHTVQDGGMAKVLRVWDSEEGEGDSTSMEGI